MRNSMVLEENHRLYFKNQFDQFNNQKSFKNLVLFQINSQDSNKNKT